ncbi:MAG: alpha/beta hydrolase [Steroidobacteraceae bacterium]|nr:alpha/beta hydrolase [Steroidobacteraceae bacterium]
MTKTELQMIRKGYVDHELGQFRYLECGQGAPLLLLHATSDSATMWEPVLPLFAQLGYRAVALDMPGFGGSPVPPSQPDAPTYGRYLREVVHNLGLGRLHVLGHHLGASLGAQMIAGMNGEVLSFSVYGWSNFDHGPYREVLRGAQPRVFDREGEAIKRHWIRRWEMSARLLTNPAESRFNEHMAIRTMIALLQSREWQWAYQAMGHTDHAELASRIDCPTLLFAGPRDHCYEETRASVKDFPDARFVALEWVGVDAPDEDPALFCHTVHDFIQARVGS